MAVDQDLLDQIAGTVADLYREVEASLITVIADELKKGLDAPTAETKLDAIGKLRTAAQAVYQRLQKTKSAAVREAIRAAYRDGHASALTGLPVSKAIKDDAKTALKQVPGAAVIENLAAALHRDLGRVEGNILRAPIDAYRAVQAGTAARIATGTATRRQASQAAWQRLMDRGIVSFTDRAGRQWRLSSYVEMIGRTNAQRAMVQGQTDRLASVGIDLVYISDNVQECKRCRPFESKVLRRNAGPIGKIKVEHGTRDGEMVTVDVLMTLDQARAKGLFHPNCRHSASAYLPGVTKLKKNTEDPEGDIARQKQRALERRIRAEKEQALGALTPEAKKAAGAKVRAAQAALRAHLAAHPKLKRLPYRESIGAGNIPGSGGPKGGPVGDMQPPTPTAPTPAVEQVERQEQEATQTAARKRAEAAAAEKARAEAEARATAEKKAEAERIAREQAEVKEKADAAKQARQEAEKKAATERATREKAEAKEKNTPKPKPKTAEKLPPLAERIALGERSRTKLSGGMYGDTSLVTLNDGSKAVHKIVKRTHISDDAVDQADAEILGGKVARALGIRAPEVHRAGPKELWIEFMDGKLAQGARKPSGYLTSDSGWRMAFFDALTDYADRHMGNWLLDGHDLVSIDHGLTFRYKDRVLRKIHDGRPILHQAGRFETLFMAPVKEAGSGIGEWIDNDMSPGDIAEARKRLTALREEFAALGRMDWWTAMMARLDAIAPHAKGTHRRIPDLEDAE